jgi:hypothetical protein
MNEQEVWLSARSAVLQAMMTTGGWTPEHARRVCNQKADEALEDFRERFPPADPGPRVPYEGWCQLEAMGHESHIGWVRDLRETPAKLVELEVLKADGTRGQRKRYGAGAIYCLTEIDEESAQHLARDESKNVCAECNKAFWSRHWARLCTECESKHEASEECREDEGIF